jgi:GNAT superfamily N-acetyltransferase
MQPHWFATSRGKGANDMSIDTVPTTRAGVGRTDRRPRREVSGRTHRTGSGELLALRDGAALLVRPIRPTDTALLEEGFDRLSMRSRWFRFLTAKKELSTTELRYFTDVDHEALVALDVADGRGVGVARYVRNAVDPQAADVAVTIVDAWQRRGRATALLTRLTDRALRAGIRHYSVMVSVDNFAMLELLRRSGTFDPSTAPVGFGTVEAQIAIPLRIPAKSR